MDRENRKLMRIQQLVDDCRFYKGEAICPNSYSPQIQKCWQYEKDWVELLADSFTNRDKLVSYMIRRFPQTDITLYKQLKMPKSLFAYIMSKSDTSMFVHEWIDDLYRILSGTYTNKHWSQLKL